LYSRKQRLLTTYVWDSKEFSSPHTLIEYSQFVTLQKKQQQQQQQQRELNQNRAVENNEIEIFGTNICKLPTILQRLKQLHKILPSAHPCNDPIQQMIQLLEEDIDPIHEENHHSNENSIETPVQTLCALLHKRAGVFQIHSNILKMILYSCPVKEFHQKNDEYILPLSRYMGDVLIVTFLLGNLASGIIEDVNKSCAEEVWWIKNIIEKKEKREQSQHRHQRYPNDDTEELMIWYQSWILCHSTALRSLPLAKEHLLKLGLVDDNMLQVQQEQTGNQIMMNNDDSLQESHLIFPSRPFKMDLPVELCNAYNQIKVNEALLVRVFDFGHLSLGQNFRGRDNSQVTVTPLHFITDTLLAFDTIRPFEYEKLDPSERHVLHTSSKYHEAIQFLLRSGTKYKMARPMNVSPPTISYAHTETTSG